MTTAVPRSSTPRTWLAVGACAAALTFHGCNGNLNPVAPSAPPPPPVVTVPPPSPGPSNPPSNPTGAVTIRINPNPVPHSGQPVTDAAGCANVRYTWYYEQVIEETGGASVTFTNRIDSFDERETNNSANLSVVVPANGSVTIRSRWCSSTNAAHSAQTRWSGSDAGGRPVSVMGPKVDLMKP